MYIKKLIYFVRETKRNARVLCAREREREGEKVSVKERKRSEENITPIVCAHVSNKRIVIIIHFKCECMLEITARGRTRE